MNTDSCVISNISKILSKNREIMAKTKDDIRNRRMFNSDKQLVMSRKIWPLPRFMDQDNRSGQPRPVTLPRADIFPFFQETIRNNDRESFHCAIGMILGMAQCFGIFPITGVLSESPRKLVFKLSSPRTAYAIVITIMLFVMALAALYRLLTMKTNDIHGSINAASLRAIFYIINCIETVFFMWLAPRWSQLQRAWRTMERLLDRDKYRSPRLRWKFFISTAAVMISALLEQVLISLTMIPLEFWSSASNMTISDSFPAMGETNNLFSFSTYEQNLGIKSFVNFIGIVGLFTSNFMDVFIMLISMGLAERYKTLNQRLIGTILMSRERIDWRDFRESYAILSTFVKRVDDNISPAILLSFASNIFYICFQLFNGITSQKGNPFGIAYFFTSFGLLVGRTVAISVLASQINSESRLALPNLYNCPTTSYNIEMQRLQQQLSTDEVCLTGMKFFSITRNFMLAVAGTIVTYEIFLLNSAPQRTNTSDAN